MNSSVLSPAIVKIVGHTEFFGLVMLKKFTLCLILPLTAGLGKYIHIHHNLVVFFVPKLKIHFKVKLACQRGLECTYSISCWSVKHSPPPKKKMVSGVWHSIVSGSAGLVSVKSPFIAITPRSTPKKYLLGSYLYTSNFENYLYSIVPCAKSETKNLQKQQDKKCTYERTMNSILLPLGIK